jgi:hypothetical protein
MRKIFLSYSFADEDRLLASQVERLIRAFGVVVTTGRNLAGGGLAQEIVNMIEDDDGLVALCTRRGVQPVAGTHPWVLQEYAIARAAALKDPTTKHAVAVWQTGVPVAGIDLGFEHVDYDGGASAEAFVRLVEIIGSWKVRAGRLLKVQLMPANVAQQIRQGSDKVRCEFRWQADGREAGWRVAEVRREIGGIYGYLRVPDSAELIQLRASGPNVDLESPYTPVRMFVELEQNI